MLSPAWMGGVHEHICTLFMLGKVEREKRSWHFFPMVLRTYMKIRSLKGGTVLHAVTLPSGIFALLEGAPIGLGGTWGPIGWYIPEGRLGSLAAQCSCPLLCWPRVLPFPTLLKMFFNQLLFLKHWLQLGCWVGLAEWAAWRRTYSAPFYHSAGVQLQL